MAAVNPVQKLRVTRSANNAATLNAGTLVYLTDTKQLAVHDGSTAGGTILTPVHAAIADQKSTGTNGGTATSGSWEVRDLNTELFDPVGIVSIASNRFTLVAGTYIIKWSAPAFGVEYHKTRLYNYSDSTVAGTGSAQYCNTTYSHTTVSEGIARVTIASSKAFEIQHQVSSTKATDGFGVASGFSTLEQYTQVDIEMY